MKDKFADIPLEQKKIHLEQIKTYIDNLYKKPVLTQLFIELTLNCNEHCRHCGSRCGDLNMQDQLTDQEILSFLSDLKTKTKPLPFLNITGGEPMLRPDFIELMHKISNMGFLWGMTTNGTLIDESMIDRLHYAGMKTVSVSIDGLEKTHNWFRQTKDGYRKSIKAVKLLTKGGFRSVMVTTVVHKQNINELEAMYEIMKSLNIHYWRIINIEPIGRAKDNKELMLSKEDYIRMLDFIKHNRKEENAFEICYGCNHWLGIENEHKFRQWYFKCTAGLQTGGIFYNGDIGACLDIERKSKTIQGNIRNDDFIHVWNNKFEIYRHNRAYGSHYCSNCSEKEYCRGGGFHTWNLDKNQPELCMYEKYLK